MNPKFIACLNENIDVVKYLVKFSVNINKEYNYFITPLSFACEKGDEDIIKYLIKRAFINNRFISKYNSKNC